MRFKAAFISSFVSSDQRRSRNFQQRACSSARPRQRWRAAATGAGAGQPRRPYQPDGVSRDDKRFQPNSSDSTNKSNSSFPEQGFGEDSEDLDEFDLFDLDADGWPANEDDAIAIDPLKNMPVSIIDASGALQIDDGSLAPEAIIPRRLVRRKSKSPDFAKIKTDLRSGFDSGIGATVLLLLLFVSWYWSNTAFNVFNKQVLHVFPYPLTCTVIQFAVAGAVMSTVWLLSLKRPPQINSYAFKAAAPLALLHAAGFMLTNMSLGKVSVAFTHTVKATEPFFSVALTPSILGDIPTWGIIGSLVPIVTGVAIASATDVSFNWVGFLSAIGSNLALQSRNVLSKRLMDTGSGKKVKVRKMPQLSEEEEDTLNSLDNVNLFASMSILAFLFLAPICFVWEGIPLLTSAAAPPVTGMPKLRLIRLLMIGGVYRCIDVLASYMILKRVSPVSHSVGNCVKRAIVIVASVIFFHTRMTSLNIIGTTLALLGVFAYSLIVSACKQNTFGPDSPFCRPIYSEEVELTEGGGI